LVVVVHGGEAEPALAARLAGAAAVQHEAENETMQTRPGAVTFLGNPLTLVGETPVVGKPAPDAALVDGGMKAVRLSDYKGKTVVLVTVPSLDTPVCDTETRRFNREAVALGDGVAVVVVSADIL
jgi:thiol peroxidase